MINVLRDAQQSLVSTSSTRILKQQHCKKRTQNVHRPQHQDGHRVCKTKLQNRPVDNLLGEPTFVTYGILEDQVAVSASAVKTLQWGRKHGHLALIVNEAKYRLITATTNSVDRQVKPAGTDPNIDGKTSNFERIKL